MMYAFMLAHKYFFFFSSSFPLIIINRSKLLRKKRKAQHKKNLFGLSKFFIVKTFCLKMSSNRTPSLMMQPQEYCSCVVCGTCVGKSRKSSLKKKCTFNKRESRDSETSCRAPSTKASKISCAADSTSEESSRDTECTDKSPKRFSSRKSTENEATCGDEALCPPDEPFDCNNEYTPSGMCPPKTAGPLGKRFDCCSKYAPCGHWDTCTDKGHQHDKLFEACDTCGERGKIFEILTEN